MPSPNYDRNEYPTPRQTDLKEYSPSIATNSIDTGSSVSSNKERDIEFAHREYGLAQVDGGIQAWLFLIASAMLEALVWGQLTLKLKLEYGEMGTDRRALGYAFSFGIFQDYYSAHEPFRGSGNIAVIGTCAMVMNTL